MVIRPWLRDPAVFQIPAADPFQFRRDRCPDRGRRALLCVFEVRILSPLVIYPANLDLLLVRDVFLQASHNAAWMHGIRIDALGAELLGHAHSEEDVGSLGLSIRQPRVVWSMPKVEIVEMHVWTTMSERGQGDDTCSSGGLQVRD